MIFNTIADWIVALFDKGSTKSIEEQKEWLIDHYPVAYRAYTLGIKDGSLEYIYGEDVIKKIETSIKNESMKNTKDYQERMNRQALSWAFGLPYHNKIDDECTPDFSCCFPDLFEKDPNKRWEYYNKNYGKNKSEKS